MIYAKKVFGVDKSKISLDFAKNYLKESNLELIEADNMYLPFKNNCADLVISDGVIHHTLNPYKSFKECIRILNTGGFFYLAVYKKWRYYPLLYIFIGGIFRLINKLKAGKFIIELFFVNLHFIIYFIFKRKKLKRNETRNIFYDYFMTPIANFYSKSSIINWVQKNGCNLVKYDRTNGNCHVFIIKK